MTPETEAKLKEIFLIVLDQPDGTDVTTLRKINCEKWDSLATVSIVAALESELGLRLNAEHQERVTSYAAVQVLVDEMVG